MYCCVTYDIRSDRLRLRLSKYLRRKGLLRYQKSVFIGRLDGEVRQEIERDWRPLLAADDRLALILLEKPVFRSLLQQTADARVRRLGQPFVFLDL